MPYERTNTKSGKMIAFEWRVFYGLYPSVEVVIQWQGDIVRGKQKMIE